MSLAYELAEQGAMSEEDNPDWHKSYLKRLKAALMPQRDEHLATRSTSPLQLATPPRVRREIEMLPASATSTSGASGARMIRQVERMELNDAQMSEYFPTLAEFWRHQQRHRSRSRSPSPARRTHETDSQSKDREVPQRILDPTKQASPNRTPDEPPEHVTRAFGQGAMILAHSARTQLIRQKQKRTTPHASDSVSRRTIFLRAEEDRKSLEQILEEEVLEEQMEMIRQQELKCVHSLLYHLVVNIICIQ